MLVRSKVSPRSFDTFCLSYSSVVLIDVSFGLPVNAGGGETYQGNLALAIRKTTFLRFEIIQSDKTQCWR